MGCQPSVPQKRLAANAKNQQLLDLIQFIGSTPMFSALPSKDHPKLAAACETQVFHKNDIVVQDGDVGTDFFMITRGLAAVWIAPPSPPEAAWRASSSIRSAPRNSSSGTKRWMRQQVDAVQKAGTKVATLRTRDYFGEQALVWHATWDVTIIVESAELECVKISQDKLKELGLQEKVTVPKRRSIRPNAEPEADEEGREDRSWKPCQKTQEEAAFLRKVLASNGDLAVVLAANPALLEAFVEVAWKQTFNERRLLMTDSPELLPCSLYIVQEGGIEVQSEPLPKKPRLSSRTSVTSSRRVSLASDGGEAQAANQMSRSWGSQSFLSLSALSSCTKLEKEVNEAKRSLGVLKRGRCYGELNLLCEVPHVAKVESLENTVVWVIDRSDYEEARKRMSDKRKSHFAELLESIDLFSGLLSLEKLAVANAIVEMSFHKDQVIAPEGELEHTFYILYEGEVSLVKEGRRIAKLTSQKGGVKYFCKTALQVPENSEKAVVAASDTVRCLALQRYTLVALLGPLEEVLVGSCAPERISVMESECSALGGSGSQTPSHCCLSQTTKAFIHQQAAKPVLLEDLRTVAFLGQGRFGTVELQEHVKTQALYALKTVKKRSILRIGKHMKAQVLNEKFIMELTDSRFLIRLFRTYRSKAELFFLMEPALGGELHRTFKRAKLFGSDVHTRYYAASIACALEHLHERFIIYRDLKPENILLDQKGHLKLTDFGMAKFVVGSTYTFCGTPCFIAPEVLQGGYTAAVDWWALGVLTWELVIGAPPIHVHSRGELVYLLLKKRALEGLAGDAPGAWKEWPEAAPGKDFVKSLLVYNPLERLPMKQNGMELLRGQAWFEGFDWEELQAGAMEAPYVPPGFDPQDQGDTFRLVIPDGEEEEEEDPEWDAIFDVNKARHS